MLEKPAQPSRRDALKCLAYGGAGTLFVLAGGVFTPVDLALAGEYSSTAAKRGRPLFVQISDTHIGFAKDANPDVNGTLAQTIALVNALPEAPALICRRATLDRTVREAKPRRVVHRPV